MKTAQSLLLLMSIALIGMVILIAGAYDAHPYILFSGSRNIYGNVPGANGMYPSIGGIYNLHGYGGFYGGLYGIGSSLNLGFPAIPAGIYGMGLFGGSLGGLYGLNPFLGLGAMYRMFGPWALLNNIGNAGGIGNTISLGSLSLGLLPASLLPAVPSVPVVAAEQAGTWTGTWFSYVKITDFGSMNLTLIEDATNSLLSGEVNLLLNNITASIPAQVKGVYSGGSTFILSGGNNTIFTSTFLLVPSATLYSIELTCTLTSPTSMTGSYVIQDLVKLFSSDIGSFTLTCISVPL